VLRGVTATRMDGRSGSGALLSAFLTALAANLDSVLPQEEAGISSAVGDLVTAVLCANQRCPEDLKSVLVTRIRRFVDAELADPELSPAGIAAAHHISVRQLHRLFEHEGTTVAELIRTRRLENCRHDLADPVLREMSITAVAARWGIPDAARFSRIFRAAYGVSPRQYRAALGAR
jgi:AraC-like DNA-binding protein